MAAQIRELVRMRMNGGTISKRSGSRHEVPPMDGKHTPTAHVESVNEEMKGLLELRGKRAEGVPQ